ncbi:uncharacterized protein BXZ73DRAFT_76234 [Epithele typhae]|uniref:uncharacterized protein n=1 Tax=Epithele typhae TaxID=378194 RepID=UPI002007A33B|nr:uncharacterized protein BXZ73DRAFT_76234 [Epithele typhae]KAH9939099.1 hypothetical protein BXZ73DRAFT_76234 [Epithele typhae]
MFPSQLAALSPFAILVCLLCFLHPVHAAINITLEDIAVQITYSPPACGLTQSTAGTEACNSSWQVIADANASDGTITQTSGANNSSGGFIPQLFLSFRALEVSIKTSPNSSALVNISVSTSNPVESVTRQLNSSVQPIEVVSLAEDRVTTLALTYIDSGTPTVLDIDAIILTVSDNNTAPFVAPSVPATTTLPTVTPSIVVPSSSSSSSSRQSAGDIAAEVLGVVLGALLLGIVVALAFLFVRRRRRRRADQPPPLPGIEGGPSIRT